MERAEALDDECSMMPGWWRGDVSDRRSLQAPIGQERADCPPSRFVSLLLSHVNNVDHLLGAVRGGAPLKTPCACGKTFDSPALDLPYGEESFE